MSAGGLGHDDSRSFERYCVNPPQIEHVFVPDYVSAARAWQRDHAWPTDLGAFKREMWPGLRTLAPSDLTRATGLSAGYCRGIIRGEAVPHPMWWAALGALAGPR
jgi:hypothetical protein